MKHAVIVGHPKVDSFNLSVAQAYCEAVRARGDEALLRDLYRLNFEPRLQAGELPGTEFGPADDVKAERALIGDCKVFAFVYPLWFYSPPAIVKGYIDRVFGMGFGYGPLEGGGNRGLLSDRRMITFTSSGAPSHWVEQEGAWGAIRALFDTHLAQVCGLSIVDHVHFGDITSDITDEAVEACLRQVAGAVERRF
ncbi:NAD(P)H dehydrogenase [Caulobacter sp. CCUG 60055]|uniref:NAD(P)H-dependent oxidoreductase n=1 Tax=Caulobacter sp. CCUG 60055 TaxID=2100090 RepID=UPI001FA6F1A1|nr:NAD(P)H-dependent oxidoreductase [Caulobacter sp. CCUG 60055]MCI3179215.1 NAD(P)H dehydrogenase [Caulobacter sp. CCUG 60055]